MLKWEKHWSTTRIRKRREEKRSKVWFRRSSRTLTAMVTTVLSANAVITTFCKMFSCKQTDHTAVV